MVKKLFLIGSFAGFLSGLLGIGGGVVIVPAMVLFMDYSQKEAQGTSLLIMFFLGIVGVIGYYFYSVSLEVGMIVLLTIGCFFGAVSGSLLAQRINTTSLKKIFALYILFAGVKIFLL